MKVDIYNRIPQRPPFLFVDEIIDEVENKIFTAVTFGPDQDFFKGHFPGNPIVPGVILQECLFQSAGLLLSKSGSGLGVVTRVQNAKFKNLVRPLDKIVMEVSRIETISNATYLKGKSVVNGKVVLTIEFSVATIEG
jgi:3-hydroxyacyl-[acyl-carrier-protein] dehydratase